jgi:hypothetical protein
MQTPTRKNIHAAMILLLSSVVLPTPCDKETFSAIQLLESPDRLESPGDYP